MFPTFDSRLGFAVLGWFQLGVVPSGVIPPPPSGPSILLHVPEPLSLPDPLDLRADQRYNAFQSELFERW